MFDVSELLISESRSDVHGDYLYATIAAWKTLSDKQTNRGIRRVIDGQQVKAQLFNDFVIRYQPTGTRIVSRDNQGMLEGLTTTGQWLPLFDAARETEPDWQQEQFARDLASETNECIDRYLTRIADSVEYQAKVVAEPDRRGTTLNLQVNNSADDAYEYDSNTGFQRFGTNYPIYANTISTSRTNWGSVFDSVTIPANATIDAATVQVYGLTTGQDDMRADIYGNDVDSASDFATEQDVTDRVNTTASVAWSTDALGTGFVVSPEIKTVIQEVVDRDGWSSSNSLCVLIRGHSNASKNYLASSYDNNTSHAAKLDIDYTEAAADGAGLMMGAMI